MEVALPLYLCHAPYSGLPFRFAHTTMTDPPVQGDIVFVKIGADGAPAARLGPGGLMRAALVLQAVSTGVRGPGSTRYSLRLLPYTSALGYPGAAGGGMLRADIGHVVAVKYGTGQLSYGDR